MPLEDILGIEQTIDITKIKRAYRKLAFKYHPDRAPEGKKEEYEERFKEINEAYSSLIDNHGENVQLKTPEELFKDLYASLFRMLMEIKEEQKDIAEKLTDLEERIKRKEPSGSKEAYSQLFEGSLMMIPPLGVASMLGFYCDSPIFCSVFAGLTTIMATIAYISDKKNKDCYERNV